MLMALAAQVHLHPGLEAKSGTMGGHGLTLVAIRRALEQADVQFIPENGGGPGVCLRERYDRADEGLRPDQLTAENDG